MSVTAFYADWADYNRRVTEAVRVMSEADLVLTVRTSHRRERPGTDRPLAPSRLDRPVSGGRAVTRG
jgi:hypothetical protein